MHREDMETVAPLWYHFTKEVRNDPEVKSFPKRYPRASRNPDQLHRPATRDSSAVLKVYSWSALSMLGEVMD